jgi:hypothetical protein
MGLFKKKPDLISDRAKALESEIAALEAQINRLDSQIARRADISGQSVGAPAADAGSITSGPARRRSDDPIFEEVDLARLDSAMEANARPEHFNELGVRKYDFPALVARVKNHLRGPSTTNPKLVSYLAAGGIQGLRPMRYEKRVARNRFIALVLLLFLIMLGIVVVFARG